MIIFSSGKEADYSYSGLLGQSADAAWLEIDLADGLVIFLIVPYVVTYLKVTT